MRRHATQIAGAILSPFCVVDPGLNAILIRSCSDLARLAEALYAPEIADRSRALVGRGIAALERLWSDADGRYLCFDRAVGMPVGGLLAAL